MKNLLQIELVESGFNNTYSLGNTYKSPNKVEFTSYLKKITFLKSANNVKGTYISIAHDLTELQRTEYRILRKHLYDAKQYKDNTCYIRKNRLHVNNRIFTPSDLENLEKESNLNLQTKPHSDPGTPVSEDKTKHSEEFIKEPIAILPQPAGNRTLEFPEFSRDNSSIQITPKTGDIKKKIYKDIPRGKQIHEKILPGRIIIRLLS
ncbi:hypothetical protein JTB14_021132 [Gonioctena quinquepunctata]|nr:hypothetical protein JTB14_021132 [Gonioctena quinquepunctata]